MFKCSTFIYLLLACLLSTFSGFSLNRDYCTFYIDEDDGTLRYYDLEYLDDNIDEYHIYFYGYCIDHFNESYLPFGKNLSLEVCLPKINRKLLYLIPHFQIPEKKFEDEWGTCCASIDSKDQRKICDKPVNYAGYLDYDFHKYSSFLEEQLIYNQDSTLCQCYWPEYSKEAGKINDNAYILFHDLFLNTALSKLIDNEYEQKYLLNNHFWELNLHGLSISCVCRSFWFSHYYRVCLNLLSYAEEDCQIGVMTQQELSKIYSNINLILLQLAKDFGPFYQTCLQKHSSSVIKYEADFLNFLYPNLINNIMVESIKIEAIQAQKFQNEFNQKSDIHKCIKGRLKNFSEDVPISDAKIESFANPHKFLAEFYLYQGLYNNDVLNFQNAIELLNTSLKYDSRNKLTYLARAYAHFEQRNFDQAIADYSIAKKLEITPPLLPGFSISFLPHKASLGATNRTEFSKGFILGGMQGFNEGSRQFFPSILHTITGIGQGLWVFSKNPIRISQEFMETASCYVALIRDNLEYSELNDLVPEINVLLGRWAALTDFEKGRQIGFVIGKYGIDVFLTGKTIQQARKFREIKYANGALTFEACQNNIQRKAILEEAKIRTKFRQSLFKDGKIKLNKDKQRNHILGLNYKEGKSPITISLDRLEKLCAEKAGIGEAVCGKIGEAGYKERIDFGEIIGECIYEKEKGLWVQEPTRIGILHYDSVGSFHVVPARPKV